MSIDDGLDSSVTSIGLDWTDEALVLFLLNIRNGNPLPLNVITDKDPFILEPWDAPASTWFLCKHEDSGCAERQIIRLMRGGYWKEIENNTQISTGILGEGRKVFWEFYVGHEPSGDKTGWQMLEYCIELKEVQEADGKQRSDYSSLCRIYFKEFDTPILEDACTHSNADQNTADWMPLATKSQVPSGEEQGPHLGAGRNEKETGPDNKYSINGLFDFSCEDFLELKDFEDNHGSPSSSSDDSSCSSGTSDGCFDSVALLRELGCENDIPTESREANTCLSPGVNQVSIEPPPTEKKGPSIPKEVIAGHIDLYQAKIYQSNPAILSNSEVLWSDSGPTKVGVHATCQQDLTVVSSSPAKADSLGNNCFKAPLPV